MVRAPVLLIGALVALELFAELEACVVGLGVVRGKGDDIGEVIDGSLCVVGRTVGETGGVRVDGARVQAAQRAHRVGKGVKRPGNLPTRFTRPVAPTTRVRIGSRICKWRSKGACGHGGRGRYDGQLHDC